MPRGRLVFMRVPALNLPRMALFSSHDYLDTLEPHLLGKKTLFLANPTSCPARRLIDYHPNNEQSNTAPLLRDVDDSIHNHHKSTVDMA